MEQETSLTLLQRLREEPVDGLQWQRLAVFCTPFIHHQLRNRFHLAEHDAEDLTQEVMQVVCRKVVVFDRQRTGSFRRWLRTITHHQLQKFWREQKRQPQPSGDADPFEALADDHSEMSREWDQQHRQHVLHRTLEQLKRNLDPANVEAFRLLVLEGLPGPEVARRLGMTLAAVHSAKARILSRLRQELRDLLD